MGRQWHTGRASGVIDLAPAGGAVGLWTIAGVDYLTDERTRIQNADAPFALGERVRIEFYSTAEGERMARSIVRTSDASEGDNFYRFVGVVDGRPAGTSGDWSIGGASFVIAPETRIKEAASLLVVGAHVSLRYTVTEGVRVISEVETIVPPGAGERYELGRVLSQGAVANMAEGSASTANVWVVGSQVYVATPATLFNDETGSLHEGGLAYVNAYVDADGALVATSIEGMSAVYLPIMQNE